MAYKYAAKEIADLEAYIADLTSEIDSIPGWTADKRSLVNDRMAAKRKLIDLIAHPLNA